MPVVLPLRDRGVGDTEMSLLTSAVVNGAVAVLVVLFCSSRLCASYNVMKPSPHFPSKTKFFFVGVLFIRPVYSLSPCILILFCFLSPFLRTK